MSLKKKLERLEEATEPQGQRVICALYPEMSEAEQAQRLEAARQEAGPTGQVCVFRVVYDDDQGEGDQ